MSSHEVVKLWRSSAQPLVMPKIQSTALVWFDRAVDWSGGAAKHSGSFAGLACAVLALCGSASAYAYAYAVQC